MSESKTIIQRYVSYASNQPKGCFWGIGDFLRGVGTLYELCKAEGYALIVDLSHHIISTVLQPSCDPSYSSVGNGLVPYVVISSTKDLKENIPSDNPAVIITNGIIKEEPYTDDCKNFIRQLIQFKPTFLDHISKHISLPSSPYKVMHFRLGDKYLQRDTIDTPLFKKLKELVDKYAHENIVIISDSSFFKKYILLQKYATVKVLPTLPCHSAISADENKIRDTMIDFYAAMGAQEIITFSVYSSWVSGFVNIIHRVYDIPLKSYTLKDIGM